MTEFAQPIILNACIPENLQGLRLDQALAKLFPQYSRSCLQTWIHAAQVSVDNQLLRGKDKVKAGQAIAIHAFITTQTHWQPQAMALTIVHEDESLFIVNKPAGLVVHPAVGNPDKTLVNALLNHAPELAQLPRAGIVHRLDKDTSGLLVVARTLTAHNHLVTQLQTHHVQREYAAIIYGQPIGGSTITAPIGRHPTQRTRMAVIASGKPAVTHFRILERFAAHTYIQVSLQTGRTHQIRVHMAHVGYPLVGDPTYGGRLRIPAHCSDDLKLLLHAFKRQALHAKKLSLQHPKTGQLMSWEAALPIDFYTLLSELRGDKIQL